MVTLLLETSIEANENNFNFYQENPDAGLSNGEACESDANITVRGRQLSLMTPQLRLKKVKVKLKMFKNLNFFRS